MTDRPGYERMPSTNLAKTAAYRPHEGKFGIVTGGSRGIGAAISRNLAAKGCSLLLVYTSDSSTKPTEELCQELSSANSVRCIPIQADLSQPTRAAPHIIATAKNNFSHPRTGKFQVDILINNAGVAGNKVLNDPSGPIEESQFQWMYNVNVLAPLLLTQACEPYLPHDRSGRIINVSSVSSAIGYPGQSIYAGTKAALEAMTRCWARELGERCTVNSVNPGPVWGDMYSQAGKEFWKVNQPYVDPAPGMNYTGDEETQKRAGPDPPNFNKTVKEGMGGKRPGFTSDIAGVVGMLCSEESAWTTGSVIGANGGMIMSLS